MRIITYLLVFVIIVIGVTFATLNPNPVVLNYYVGQKTMALSFLLVLVFALGCLLGLGVGLMFVLKAKIKSYRIRQRLKNAEKEVQNLRAIPLQDRH